MAPDATWMIYGATGYTAGLIAEEAVRRGQRPILAGRRREAIEALGRKLQCETRVFALNDPTQIARELGGLKLVLNCAGPFSATARPLMDGCIAAGVHYLDITGEIEAIEAAAERHARARDANVSLLPAMGFDVVPSDCLAARLGAELADATHLQLAFADTNGVSPGTAKTIVENLPRGGRARIDSRIVRVPVAWKTLEIPFNDRRRWAVTIPWGDVASAYHSTGIHNIEVYTALPQRAIARMRRLRFLAPLTAPRLVQKLLKWRIGRRIRGPSDDKLATGRAHLWAKATNARGRSVEATLETPGGYQLTRLTALLAVEKTLAGQAPIGFATPSRAFGVGMILEVPSVELHVGAALADTASID